MSSLFIEEVRVEIKGNTLIDCQMRQKRRRRGGGAVGPYDTAVVGKLGKIAADRGLRNPEAAAQCFGVRRLLVDDVEDHFTAFFSFCHCHPTLRRMVVRLNGPSAKQPRTEGADNRIVCNRPARRVVFSGA
nr:hypothetical protein [Noviherbaspirillum pedocola]